MADISEGREALIHLHVPAEIKARWVRASRATGMKLSDWIIQRLEAIPMNVFKVPDTLAEKYHGTGYALAATVAGQLVDIAYLADALPDFSGERSDLPAALDDQRLAPTVRRLQALGQVHVGMLSAWEFCEL